MSIDCIDEALLVSNKNVRQEGNSAVAAVLEKHLVNTCETLSFENKTFEQQSCLILAGTSLHPTYSQLVNLTAEFCIDLVDLLLISSALTVTFVNNRLKLEDSCIALFVEALKLLVAVASLAGEQRL